MFFVLSKLLDFVLEPALWLVLLPVAALVTRSARWRYRLLVAATVLGVVFTNPALSNELLRWWELPPVRLSQLAPQPYDAAVLLTGVTEPRNGPADRVYLGRGADRFTNALWLYRAGRAKRIIISGGSGSLRPKPGTRTEAQDLAVLLRLAGVPSQHIWLETQSRNTRENARNTRALLQQRLPQGQPRLLLVTSAFHQRRALGCFSKAGLQVTAFPAGYLTAQREATPAYWLLPSSEALQQWSVLLHEVAGYVVYRLLGYA
ncbi:YdcF family protein [Hymenobacter latericus]|uniref:YdcF family protein n=1 Tax=Hymenobacter sp. YIM 151858-1 TaxID=2987688 RepID=UPI002227769B|nr:YdcF family protein [Hymenobacter sp. YIM 151858-1]UYZ60497.1 YdcF family protein [Hymenobacter sp. YIM 151858-1]